ncbi:MAK10-like protein [Tanacetum coccineum]
MAFRGNTRDLGSFGEETDKITDLHQIHEEVLFTERGDGVAGIKRRCRDLSSDDVRDLATVSGRGRLKEDLESSTQQRRSITTWEDLTTRFLAQFFPPGMTAKLRNDIMMFQQHHEEPLSEAWTRFKDLLQKVPHHGIDLWLQDLALYDNESLNDPRDFAKLFKAITLPQDVPSTSDRHLIELENQVQRLIKAHLALMKPTQMNKITTLYDMISKVNLLWKIVSEKLDDTPLYDTAGGPTAQMNFTSIDYHTKEELRSKGIKSPSKLLFPKYLSQSFIIEQNKNPSSPKRVLFVISIVILNKENEVEEEGSVEPSKTEYTNRKNTDGTDEEVESEKEVKEETEGETEEEEEDDPEHFDTFLIMKELRYHEWLLKNPWPPWIKAKIRTGNVNNVKFSCMIGQFNKEQAYLDLESTINVMSRLHYNWIMSNRLEPRMKPSNPKKNYNFIGRVKGLRVFVRNFTYECDFMVLEDTTCVIDRYLGSVVFRKPFIEATGLAYNKEEGTVMFKRDKEKIMFKMPPQNGHRHSKFDGRKGQKEEQIRSHVRTCDFESSYKTRRKAHLLEDKQISSVRVFDEVISTWMAFGGNTRDFGSFGEETDKITDLDQIHEEVLFTEREDGVAGIKRRRRDLSSDVVGI